MRVHCGPIDDRGRRLVVVTDGASEYRDTIDINSGFQREQMLQRAAAQMDISPDDMPALDAAIVRAADAEDTRPAAQDREPTESMPYHAFPTNVLPKPVNNLIVVGARSIQCDAAYIALPVLSVLAASIGTTRRLRLKPGWYAPSILWTAIVGESGTAKSPALRLATDPIKRRQGQAIDLHAQDTAGWRVDHDQWQRAKKAWERGKDSNDPPEEPVEPICQRYVVSDTTVEALAPILLGNARGILLVRDELASWLGAFDRYSGGKGADAGAWLSLYSADTLIVDRRTAGTLYVPHAAVSLTGGIQPGTLARALGVEHREDGLAARLLLACPPRQARAWRRGGIDEVVTLAYAEVVGRLHELQHDTDDDGRPCARTVCLSREAEHVWAHYYDAHNREMADLVGDLAAAWSKLEETAARLALIIHLSRWASGEAINPDVVDEASMQAGAAIAGWAKHEAQRVYSILDETEGDRDQRRLVEWIERHGGAVTAREVYTGCRWLRGSGTAEAALNELAKAGMGTWESSPAGQRGQPTRRFQVTTNRVSMSAVSSNGKIVEENNNTADADNADSLHDISTDSTTDKPPPPVDDVNNMLTETAQDFLEV
jgi:hypothetical protein